MRFSAGVQGYFLTEVRKGGETAQKTIRRRVIAADGMATDDRLGEQEAQQSEHRLADCPYNQPRQCRRHQRQRRDHARALKFVDLLNVSRAIL